LALPFSLDHHLGALRQIFGVMDGFLLSRPVVLTRDVVTDQLQQLIFRKRLAEGRRLHRGDIAAIRRTRKGGELGVPFEVAQRAQLFASLRLVVCSESCTTFLPSMATRGSGTRRR
jgi:hypothetical protein